MSVTCAEYIAKLPDELRLRFGLDEAQKAADEWNFNCGPGALCAILGLTPDEVRPRMGDFERKGYTNPTLMFEILKRQPLKYDRTKLDRWSVFGLARIQWGGPWMKAGVPVRARYRHTHWVACRLVDGVQWIYDVNAMCVGGWIVENVWESEVALWLMRETEPKADGTWSRTHCIEIFK